jgi:hypothetical protein
LKAIAKTTQKMPPTRGSGRQDINRRNLEPESFRVEDRQTRRHHTISFLLSAELTWSKDTQQETSRATHSLTHFMAIITHNHLFLILLFAVNVSFASHSTLPKQ